MEDFKTLDCLAVYLGLDRKPDVAGLAVGFADAVAAYVRYVLLLDLYTSVIW